jgi:uncharacterized DUF497 family protein
METEKNLHAAIPSALLTEATRVAQDGNMSVDELVADAMERRLREIRLAKLYTYGEERARAIGVTTEGEVEALVHQYREENTGRGR